MLILYTTPTCPFCQRVIQVAENLGIKLELKDISETEQTKTDLVSRGGKAQVPYLVDTERGEEMYESGEIVEYLRENYAGKGDAQVERPRVHVGGSTCESCEG